jgi:hypothetical protein
MEGSTKWGILVAREPYVLIWVFRRHMLNTPSLAGTGKSVLRYVAPLPLSIFPDAQSRSSVVIDHLSDSNLDSLIVYFYFDFKDERKQTLLGLLSSLVFQLATRSRPCFDILIKARTSAQKVGERIASKIHADARLHATDSVLLECLKSMLQASSRIFMILDALDECPRTTRRTDILPFLRKLVGFDVPGLHLLVSSRPEHDVLQCMNDLPSHPLDLDKAHEQNGELSRFISHELSSSENFADWPADVKLHARRILVERSRGM